MKNKYSVIREMKHESYEIILLLIPLIIFAFIFFSLLIINISLKKGMDNTEKRLGADIVLVPKGAKEKAENIMLEGARGSFWFDKKILNNISDVEGIDRISAQFFLKSLSADCCSSEVEIVFYDPETDFIVQPWIENRIDSKQNPGSVIAGSSIDVDKSRIITLFGRDYPVEASMAKTGTALDRSVYITFESFDIMIGDALEKGSFMTGHQTDANLISSIYIDLTEGYDMQTVIENCKSVAGAEFDVVYPRQLMDTLSESIKGIFRAIHLFIIVSFLLCGLILLWINILVANEKKRKIALLRVLGVSKKCNIRRMFVETVLIGISGGLLGCIFGMIIVIPFTDYIGTVLKMPYPGPGITGIIFIDMTVIVAVTCLSAIAAVLPVIRVGNIEPYLVLRKEGE